VIFDGARISPRDPTSARARFPAAGHGVREIAADPPTEAACCERSRCSKNAMRTAPRRGRQPLVELRRRRARAGRLRRGARSHTTRARDLRPLRARRLRTPARARTPPKSERRTSCAAITAAPRRVPSRARGRDGGVPPVEVATYLNGLAIVYKYLARYTEAARLSARRCASWSRPPARACALASILHTSRPRAQRAEGSRALEPFARRGLAIRRRALGAEHPDVAADARRLGAILHGCDASTSGAAAAPGHARLRAHPRQHHFEVGFNLGEPGGAPARDRTPRRGRPA